MRAPPFYAAAVNLDDPLSSVGVIPQGRVRQLERFGLSTVGDLVTHFPYRWEDRRQFDHFPRDASPQAVCVCGVVKKMGVKRVRGRMRIFEAVLAEENPDAFGGELICRWFNQYWVEKAVAVGQRLIIYGKPKRRGPQIIVDHPELEVLEEEGGESLHVRRIVPIHRATEGLTPRALREIIWDVLRRLDARAVPNLVPPALDARPRLEMLRQIHFPDSEEQRRHARRHLVLTEFFALQLAVAWQRAEHSAQPGRKLDPPGELMERLHAALPYPLTGAQSRTIAEIRRDLASPRPMNRLLHGEVGSGKTVVALSAMLLAVEAGHQAVLMAPTQILAEQHYANFRRLLEPLGVNLALRTGSRREETALPLFDAAGGRLPDRAAGAQIIVGTHALLYEGAGISNLGLAVIDEQHKFGVMQRARLREQAGEVTPDVLVMTATPIPRTLTMTVYGDLDVSVIDELPPGRGKIVTVAREGKKLAEAAKFFREHLEAGRQGYIVYPLIDASEKTEAKAAAAEYQKWCELLAPMRCELLHGRVLPEEKDAIMERFRAGRTKALIATTVIEVGIDVPNANLMLIENAERFGLAQLHQLRGRIGRGTHKSYCILLTDAEEPEPLERLKLLEKTSDGFAIAEADLEIRGPGDLLGTAQTGGAPVKLGNVVRDVELMRMARGTATVLLERDPKLEQPGNAPWKRLLEESRGRVEAGGAVGLAQVS
jgi:ATP-dependent DNA helicase RecG